MTETHSNSPDETESLAARWAATLQPGQTILLSGDLGAGKTCFVRGMVQGWQGDARNVSSPSFSLVNEYPTPHGTIHHWDLYRLTEGTDWAVLDLDDHLKDPEGLTVIEWPERRPDLDGYRVRFLTRSDETRNIIWESSEK